MDERLEKVGVLKRLQCVWQMLLLKFAHKHGAMWNFVTNVVQSPDDESTSDEDFASAFALVDATNRLDLASHAKCLFLA